MERRRAFVAAYPPLSVVDIVRAFPRGEGMRWVPDSQLHVTVRFLGDEVDVDAVDDALGSLFVHRVVDANAGPKVGQFGGRVVHVPVGGLTGVAAAVDAAVDPLVGSRQEPFIGHLTLGRARRRTKRLPLVGSSVSATWPVETIELVVSVLSPRGATHRRVARYQLSSSG